MESIETNLPTPFDKREIGLKYKEAKVILENHKSYKKSVLPPVKPKGGEMYLFSSEEDKTRYNDWRCDQYRWEVNNGTSNYPCGKGQTPFIKKYHHKVSKSSTFQRHAWWLLENPNIVLVHYIGNEAEYQETPHGNSKSKTREYVRTCPSVVSKLKQRDIQTPISVYQDELSKTCSSSHQAVLQPRNLKQVQNSIQLSRQEKRLSQDEIYNLNLLAHELKGYISEITTYPDLKCFFGLPDVMSEFNRLLQVKSNFTLYCSYDTTFDLGDFYLTPIVFRHILFETSPVIPLAFMLHKRKYQTLHEDFLRHLTRHIPNLKNSKVPIITDREYGITNAITNILPNSQILFCWNHFKQDVIRWLQRHKASHNEIQVYVSHVEEILMSETVEEFHDNIVRLSSMWSESFREYFVKHIQKDIEKYAGRFLIEPLNIYNPYSGITNNSAESMNAVIKRLIKWKEAPADTLVLCLQKLQLYYWREILRGFCNLGQYQLKEEFKDLRKKIEEIQFPTDMCNPQDIIDKVKGSIQCFQNKVGSSDNEIITQTTIEPSEMEKEKEKEEEENSEILEESQTDTSEKCNQYLNATAVLDMAQEKCPINKRHWTQAALAQAVIDEKRIFHCAVMQTFIVQGSKSDKYAVTLHPKEKCQCGSTGTCYHILAAKKSIGLDIEQKKTRVNLTQLAKNNRKRVDKKSGRKKPSTIDYIDIIPAPDSNCASKSILEEELDQSYIGTDFASPVVKLLRLNSNPEVLNSPHLAKFLSQNVGSESKKRKLAYV